MCVGGGLCLELLTADGRKKGMMGKCSLVSGSGSVCERLMISLEFMKNEIDSRFSVHVNVCTWDSFSFR